MRKVAIPAALVLALELMTGVAFAQTERFTVIHMTKRHGTSKYTSECLGTVTTERLPSRKGDPLTWIIRNGNAHNTDDVCENLDKSQVSLHFKDDVMGVPAMKVLTAKKIMVNGNMVWGIQGNVDPGIPKGTHEYVVYYRSLKAGPDPEIEVDCNTCGGK